MEDDHHFPLLIDSEETYQSPKQEGSKTYSQASPGSVENEEQPEEAKASEAEEVTIQEKPKRKRGKKQSAGSKRPISAKGIYPKFRKSKSIKQRPITAKVAKQSSDYKRKFKSIKSPILKKGAKAL